MANRIIESKERRPLNKKIISGIKVWSSLTFHIAIAKHTKIADEIIRSQNNKWPPMSLHLRYERDIYGKRSTIIKAIPHKRIKGNSMMFMISVENGNSKKTKPPKIKKQLTQKRP